MRLWTRTLVVWIVVAALGFCNLSQAEGPALPNGTKHTIEIWSLLTGKVKDEQAFVAWLVLWAPTYLFFKNPGTDPLSRAKDVLQASAIWANAEQRRKWIEAGQKFLIEEAALFEELHKAELRHEARVQRITTNMNKLLDAKLGVKNGQRKLLEQHIDSWKKSQDLAPFLGWLKQYKHDHPDQSEDFKRWNLIFEGHRVQEEIAANNLIAAARPIQEFVNRQREMLGQPADYHPVDQGKAHLTGRVHYDGKSIRPKTLATKLKAQCNLNYAAIVDNKNRESSLVDSRANWRRAKNLAVLSWGGYLAYKTIRSGLNAAGQYGGNPIQAAADAARKEEIKAIAQNNSEASFPAQLLKYKSQFQPFTDSVVENLTKNKSALLDAGEYLHRAYHKEWDRTSKEATFDAKTALEGQVIQGIGLARETDAEIRTLDVPQLIAYLHYAGEESDEQYQLWVERVYKESLRKLFPQIAPASHEDKWPAKLQEILKPMIKQTIEDSKKMEIRVPENFVPHPIIPEAPKSASAPAISPPTTASGEKLVPSTGVIVPVSTSDQGVPVSHSGSSAPTPLATIISSSVITTPQLNADLQPDP